MSTLNDGGPAFPQPNHIIDTEARGWMQDSGMSLRAWLSGQALAGLSQAEMDEVNIAAVTLKLTTHEVIAKHCVELADAVIAELAKNK